MKRMLARMAGGYAGLGALAFLMHRARYHSTSRLRDWLDNGSKELEAELDSMRGELVEMRTEIARKRKGRRPLQGTPASQRLAA